MSKFVSQRGVARPLQLAGLLLVLLVSWALWSGIYKPLLLGLGVFSAVLSAWLAPPMGFFRLLVPLPISPTMVELTTTESTEAGKVIMGNSITLSPGTVTIDVHGDRLLVHCLTLEGAEALQSMEVQRRTTRLRMG